LDEAGMAFDFGDLKGVLRELADGLDHTNLNELAPVPGGGDERREPGRWFFEELKARLPEGIGRGLLYARVWESPTQWAQYGPASAGGGIPAYRAPGL
jgi:6-pyruvoyltetrahydropterin/6-carboxytetrahydropterin synthase